MLDEIKYEKFGNVSLLRKRGIGIYSTRNYTDYTQKIIQNLIWRFKDNFVFYFTYDFYLRAGIYRIKNLIFEKVIVIDRKYLHHNIVKNTETQLIMDDYSDNKRVNYLIKDLVILKYVSKIVILEATKFSQNLKIISEIASENSVDVYCLPGKITDKSSYGTNRIIYDGAIPLFDFELLNS